MTSQVSTIRAVLFDIGGVVVLSPMLAISAYEKEKNIPSGYINHAIVRSSPNGAWSQIERGEIPLDENFYQKFTRDLSNPVVWAEYYTRGSQRTPGDKNNTKVPEMPIIDGKYLFWEMMRVSREFDAYIAPAIRRIRAMTSTTGTGGGAVVVAQRKYIVGALTNDYQFPEGHEYSNDPTKKTLRGLFDVFISSSAVGMRKPEKRIYELAVKRLNEERIKWFHGASQEEGGVSPGQVVFLDDIGMNLKGAQGAGLKGVKVPLGESWKAVKELEGILGLDEGALFDEGVVEELKKEGKWGSERGLRDSKI